MIALLIALQGAAVAVSVMGAVIATIGARRVRRGLALQRGAASLSSQLSRPPIEVLGEVYRGVALQWSGGRLARRGLYLAAGGFVAGAAALAWRLAI